jgi:hypothetical protein
MTFIVGPQIIGPSTVLVAGQPLRGVWRRSASATALEVASGGLADTSLAGLFGKLDERLPRASLVRGSAPTYTEDTITMDLVVNAHPPQGLTASACAQIADQLVTGLPLVSLNGRARKPGEEVRAAERDTAATAGQAAADAASVTRWLGELGTTAKLVLAGVVIVALVGAAVYFAPRPKKSE